MRIYQISLCILCLFYVGCKKSDPIPVIAAAPVINSISPASGHAGTTVTIKGKAFDVNANNDSVTFNGKTAVVSSATDTSVVVIIPAGAGSGPVILKTTNGHCSGPDFKYLNDVYVAGIEGTTSIATCWKNGVPTNLTDGSERAVASSVVVKDKDVYVAGYKFINGVWHATVWKNGVTTVLSNQYSIASSIFVSGSDVYAAGYEAVNGIYTATYWKNGAPIHISQLYSYANAIYVAGNDVYIAGVNGDSVVYWKNGSPVNLAYVSQRANGSSIYVVGQDVFVAGYETVNNVPVATYWKNGVAFHISTNSSFSIGYALYVTPVGDVYVAGYEAFNGNSTATYWKNGVSNHLSNKFSNANAIFVSGTDVFVAGFETTNIAYWENGVITYLATNVQSGNAYSIFAN